MTTARHVIPPVESPSAVSININVQIAGSTQPHSDETPLLFFLSCNYDNLCTSRMYTRCVFYGRGVYFAMRYFSQCVYLLLEMYIMGCFLIV